MATIAGVSISAAKVILPSASLDSTKLHYQTRTFPCLNNTNLWRKSRLSSYVRPLWAVPEQISDKVAKSVKAAEEACEGDPKSGECAAAWDEVEELSAASSHARDRKKEADVLEDYCKDNPEAEECRTYED